MPAGLVGASLVSLLPMLLPMLMSHAPSSTPAAPTQVSTASQASGGTVITVAGPEVNVGSVRQNIGPNEEFAGKKGTTQVRRTRVGYSSKDRTFGASPLELQLLQSVATSLTTQQTNMTQMILGM